MPCPPWSTKEAHDRVSLDNIANKMGSIVAGTNLLIARINPLGKLKDVAKPIPDCRDGSGAVSNTRQRFRIARLLKNIDNERGYDEKKNAGEHATNRDTIKYLER